MGRDALSLLIIAAVLAPGTLASQPIPTVVIDPEPEILIGSIDGEDPYLFQFLDHALLLQGGGLAAADRVAGEIRVFDKSRSFIRSFGGRGEGPSEFEYIDGLEVVGDTFLVFDPMRSKIAHFDSSGELVRTNRLPGQAILVGFDENRRRYWWSWTTRLRDGPHPALRVQQMAIGYSEVDSPEEVRVISEMSGLWRVDMSPYPFSPTASPVLFRDSLLVPDAVEGTLTLIDDRGVAHRTIRVPLDPLDARIAWRVLEKELKERGEDALLKRSEDLPNFESLPRFATVLVDDEDRIWVKRFDPAEDTHWLGGWAGGEGGSWLVLSPNGTPISSVQLSSRFVVLRIEDGRMIGRLRDEWDVQYLAVYDLPTLTR